MTTSPDTAAALIAAALQKQIGAIETAIIRARRNEVADLNALERETALLCRRVTACNREEAQEFEMKLIEMITKLDELAAEIRDYKERMRK